MILSKSNVQYSIILYDYYWKIINHLDSILCCWRLSSSSCVWLLKDNVSYHYSSIQEYRWCSCLDACCLFQSWMFLQDKAWGLVFHWGRKTQLGTEPHLLCWIPSHSKTLPSNLLWHKNEKQHIFVEDTNFKNKSNQHKIALKQMETHWKNLHITQYHSRTLLFHLPALCPCRQKTPGGQREPVLLSVGLGTVAPIRQRNPAAHTPDGSTKPSDPQNWPAGHARHSPANTDGQLWPQSKQQNKLPARWDQSSSVSDGCTLLQVSKSGSKIT